MQIPIEVIVGPVGAVAVLIWIVDKLWKAHQAADKREQDRADALDQRLDRIADALAAGLSKADPK